MSIHSGPKNMDDFEKLGRQKMMREKAERENKRQPGYRRLKQAESDAVYEHLASLTPKRKRK